MNIRTIDRNIKQKLELNNSTYGLDDKGICYKLTPTTIGSMDKPEIVLKWYKMPTSHEKLKVLNKFKKLI